jgi:hypothetical protein
MNSLSRPRTLQPSRRSYCVGKCVSRRIRPSCTERFFFVSVLQAEFFIVSANTTVVAQIILRRKVCFSVNPGFLYSKIFFVSVLQAEFFIVSANTTAVAQIILRRQVCFSVNPAFLYSKIFLWVFYRLNSLSCPRTLQLSRIS